MSGKGLAAMLVVKRSASVISEENLKNPLHAGNEALKRGIHSGFETQGRCHQKSKPELSVASQKGLMASKKIKTISPYPNDHSTL